MPSPESRELLETHSPPKIRIKQFVMRPFRIALWVLVALSVCSAARAQNGQVAGITFGPTGTPRGGVNTALCYTLTTTAASVTSNVATLTFASNPITAGFVALATLTVSGFTGGDTYFNGSYLIASTSPTTISFALVHANAAAGTNGAVYQTGSVAQACAPLASTFTDNTGSFSMPNPSTSDGLGNYNIWVAPGFYNLQIYGPGVGTTVYLVGVACVPANTTTGCGVFSGSVSAGQMVYGTGANQVASSPNFLWNQSTLVSNLAASTPATNVANQNSPTWTITAKYWTGAASADDSWTFQVIPGAGANPATELRIIPGATPGGDLFHVKGAFTADANANFGAAVNIQALLQLGLTAGLNAILLQGNTPANAGANDTSGNIKWVGEYWTGAVSAHDTWTVQNTLGAGANPTSKFTFVHTGTPGAAWAAFPNASMTGVTNDTGLQVFNTTTTCTTGAGVGNICTTAAITLPVAEADTSYRLVCTGKGLTNVPVVIATTNSSASQFTITIAALTAAAASFASFDCVAGHN